jgi:hypothetical protein
MHDNEQKLENELRRQERRRLPRAPTQSSLSACPSTVPARLKFFHACYWPKRAKHSHSNKIDTGQTLAKQWPGLANVGQTLANTGRELASACQILARCTLRQNRNLSAVESR